MDKELGKIRKKYTSDKAMTGAGSWVAGGGGGGRQRVALDSPVLDSRCAGLPCTPHPDAAYDKRKYMWKLLYTRLLGYDVDFGVKNASDLVAASGCAALAAWWRARTVVVW